MKSDECVVKMHTNRRHAFLQKTTFQAGHHAASKVTLTHSPHTNCTRHRGGGVSSDGGRRGEAESRPLLTADPAEAHAGDPGPGAPGREARPAAIVLFNHITRFVMAHLGLAAVNLHLTKLLSWSQN